MKGKYQIKYLFEGCGTVLFEVILYSIFKQKNESKFWTPFVIKEG